MRREYISIWRRPITRTEPGLQMRDLSLRSTSVHIVSSDSSLVEFRSSRMLAAAAGGSAPAEQLGRRSRARLAQRLAGHHLEQVARLERAAGLTHDLGVLAGLVVAG